MDFIKSKKKQDGWEKVGIYPLLFPFSIFSALIAVSESGPISQKQSNIQMYYVGNRFFEGDRKNAVK